MGIECLLIMHFNFASRTRKTKRSSRRTVPFVERGFSRIKSLAFLTSIALLVSAGFLYGFRLYSGVVEAKPAIDVLGNVKPTNPVAVSFPDAVLMEGYTENIRLSPDIPVSFSWEEGNRKLLISPKDAWDMGMRYAVSLPAGRTTWFGNVPASELSFETWASPQVVSVSPKDGERDVLLGIEDPIVVTVDRSAEDTYFKFSLNPEADVVYENNPEKTEFRVLPKEVKPGESYEFVIFAKYRNDPDTTYREIYRGHFETLPPPPSEWAKDFATRIEQAKRFTKPVTAEGKYIDINLSSQVMVLFENGTPLDAYMVSSGKRGMDTPKGEYHIQNKTPRAWSKTYGLYMPYWMAIVPSGKYGIHELPEWPGGYKEGANHLGTPVSHGCVRLGVGPAETVYDWAPVGTLVVVH